MFPLRDHNPSAVTPVVTIGLIALNLGVQLWVALALPSDLARWSLWGRWAMVPAEVSNGDGLWTLVTATFLHAGWLHVLGNMLFLWVFGDNLEEEMGRVGFLLFYLAGGAAANLGQWAAAPGSTLPTLGASGAVAAVMGGYLLLFPRARVDLLVILVIVIRVVPVPAWTVLLLWLGLQGVSGLLSDPQAGGVAYWAHAGGFLAGLAMALPVWLRRGGPGFWARTGGEPPHPDPSRGPLVPTRVPAVRRRR